LSLQTLSKYGGNKDIVVYFIVLHTEKHMSVQYKL